LVVAAFFRDDLATLRRSPLPRCASLAAHPPTRPARTCGAMAWARS